MRLFGKSFILAGCAFLLTLGLVVIAPVLLAAFLDGARLQYQEGRSNEA